MPKSKQTSKSSEELATAIMPHKGDSMSAHKSFDITATSICPLLLNTMTIESLNPQNRPARGQANEYERENWRRRMTVCNGRVAFPSEYIEAMLVGAASQLGERIPGQGRSTYARLFKSSVFADCDLISTNVEATSIQPFIKAVASNPSQKNSGRVLRYRPILPEWEASFRLHVTNPLLTPEVFKRTLTYGGRYVGIGDWRPKFGRIAFTVKEVA